MQSPEHSVPLDTSRFVSLHFLWRHIFIVAFVDDLVLECVLEFVDGNVRSSREILRMSFGVGALIE